MKTAITILLISLCTSCSSQSNRQKENLSNQNPIINDLPKEISNQNTLTLLQRKENLSLENGKLSNLDSINGFRGLKFNTNFENLFFVKRWGIYDFKAPDSSNLKSADIDISYIDPSGESIDINIGDVKVTSVYLYFLDNKLIGIHLSLKLYVINFPDSKLDIEKSNTLYSDLKGVFGQPQKPLGKETGIEKYNYKSAIWNSNHVTMELVLNESYTFYRDGKEVEASPSSSIFFYLTDKSKYIEPSLLKTYLKELSSKRKPEKLIREF